METEPGVPSIFAVNVLAPYIVTALIERPDRLVRLSSGYTTVENGLTLSRYCRTRHPTQHPVLSDAEAEAWSTPGQPDSGWQLVSRARAGGASPDPVGKGVHTPLAVWRKGYFDTSTLIGRRLDKAGSRCNEGWVDGLRTRRTALRPFGSPMRLIIDGGGVDLGGAGG